MMITAMTGDLNEAELFPAMWNDRRKNVSDQSVGSATR
jgi:hypothetical protein